MPPLFVYAVVFLSLLIAAGFVACLWEGKEPRVRKAEPEPAAPRAPLRRVSAGLHAAPVPSVPAWSAGHAGSVPAASEALQPPRIRFAETSDMRLGGSLASSGRAPDAVSAATGSLSLGAAALSPAWGSAAPFGSDAVPQPGYPVRTAAPPAPMGDPLALQVAEMTRLVAELRAERQGFEDEIRRLHQVVQDATAAVGEFNAVRPARPASSAPAGGRHINVHDLRPRRRG